MKIRIEMNIHDSEWVYERVVAFFKKVWMNAPFKSSMITYEKVKED